MKPVRPVPFYSLLVLSFAVLGGCSTYSVPGGDPAAKETAPQVVTSKPAPAPVPATPPSPLPSPAEPATSKAYQPLLDKAGEASGRGDYEQALALLERAQRIDPDSAEIYLAMARTHQASGDPSQARAMAERGLLYCSGRVECDALRGLTR